MIKPIKFQNGGSVSADEQAANDMMAVLQAIGIDPNVVEEKLSQISDPEIMGEIWNDCLYIAQHAQNPDSETQNRIENLRQFFSDESEIFKCGGKMDAFTKKYGRGKKVDCGCKGTKIKKAQDGGYLRAAGYYQNHADSNIIRKIQNFLYGRGYDLGEAGIDGKFGQNTYNAIRKYQQDIGVKDDWMWGEDTNAYHRVLGAGDTTFSGSRSGAHMGRHTYTDNYKGTANPSRQFSTTPGEISRVIEQAIANPEWFWGDTDDAVGWRQILGKKLPGGQEGSILETIYNETPDEIKSTITPKKLPTNIRSAAFNAGINRARNEAAPVVASALSLPVIGSELLAGAVAAPLSTAGSLVGAGTLGRAGEWMGGKIGGNTETHHLTRDLVGDRDIPTVARHEKEGATYGRIVGSTVGAGVGAAAGKRASGFWNRFKESFTKDRGERFSNASSTKAGGHQPSTQDVTVAISDDNLPAVIEGNTPSSGTLWRPTGHTSARRIVNDGPMPPKAYPFRIDRPFYNPGMRVGRSPREVQLYQFNAPAVTSSTGSAGTEGVQLTGPFKNARYAYRFEPNIDWGWSVLGDNIVNNQ